MITLQTVVECHNQDIDIDTVMIQYISIITSILHIALYTHTQFPPAPKS